MGAVVVAPAASANSADSDAIETKFKRFMESADYVFAHKPNRVCSSEMAIYVGYVMNIAMVAELLSVIDDLKLWKDDRAKFWSYVILKNMKTDLITGKMYNADKEC